MAKDLFERDRQLKQLIMAVTKFIETLQVLHCVRKRSYYIIIIIIGSLFLAPPEGGEEGGGRIGGQVPEAQST